MHGRRGCEQISARPSARLLAAMPKHAGPRAGESEDAAESSRAAHANGGAQPGASSSDGDDFANRLMVEVRHAALMQTGRCVGAACSVRG